MSNQDEHPVSYYRRGTAIKRAINDFKVKVEGDPHISNLLKKRIFGNGGLYRGKPFPVESLGKNRSGFDPGRIG